MDSVRFLEPDVLRPLLLLALSCLFVWLCVVVIKRVTRPKKTRGSRYPFIGKERLWFFVIVALALTIVSYARPYTDKGIPVVKSGCIQLILALDASVSMLAEDLGESRLETAKKELANLYAKKILNAECDRISFFTFDGLPRPELPYSRDKDRFLTELGEVSAVKSLLTGDESPWYSDVTALLEKMRVTFDSQEVFFKREYPEDTDVPKGSPGSNTIVLLVTDGDMEIDDSTRGRFEVAVGALRSRRLKVYGLGIGTYSGTPLLRILSYPALQGRINDSIVTQLNEEWRGVSTRLDTRLLDVVASRTGGAVSTVDTKGESAAPFLGRIISMNRSKMIGSESVAIDANRELWWYVLNGALLFLLIGILLL